MGIHYRVGPDPRAKSIESSEMVAQSEFSAPQAHTKIYDDYCEGSMQKAGYSIKIARDSKIWRK